MKKSTRVNRYLAVDQYGTKMIIKGATPRKAIMEATGSTYANAIYVGHQNYSMKKVGYYSGGAWYNIFKMESI